MNDPRALTASRPRVDLRDAIRIGMLLAAATLAVPILRELAEASMALQMLVLLPLMFACGWGLPAWLSAAREARLIMATRAYGLALQTFAALATSVWMVPLALDLSRIDGSINLAKYALVLGAGTAARFGCRGGSWPVTLFFGGNFAWMMVTAGVLYLQAERRLCGNFLLRDQQIAGAGLMAFGLLLGVVICLWAARRAAEH
ncbi:hypothetical protein C2I33_09410 [Ralstonia solanacearum]|uniref:hypothetical protein n=1 Tax=Ralstonia solanacearum TaxID=305 RepID=UPI0001817314|nr:hypothetical protein [Ralstonia solanacearum]MDC6178077.1 hypothetical protein [Ralstonia solanacearum]MDC6210441.1 hypothetical protein [Ralstonia solanacearum]MDC6238977.1 hypothetical protein [Ralstonia solanacearum]MDD7800767.1 hypothetical protein [Ralstonia solanacearum]TYZ55184.1 hypothetical protein C2I33_09410 [Ralstonia solanacearum]